MQYILMDLDGTITNPKIGITKSVQYALKQRNILIEDLDSLCKHIGPPLRESFSGYYGFSEEEAEAAVKSYREYFEVKGIYENEEYEGMASLLERLKKDGKQIIVATSKPEIFAKKIIDYFHLEDYISDVCGSELDGRRSEKAEVIHYALEKNGITDLSQVVMVGDRKYDILGAKKEGISTVGVLYGFGSLEELKEAGADWIVASVAELYDVL